MEDATGKGLDLIVQERRPKGRERRRGRRTRADASYFAGCEPLEGGARGPNIALKLVDISARGACFVSRTRPRPGLRVRMLIVRPGAAARASIDATVRWSETVDSVHVTGVEFDRAAAGLGLPDAPVRVLKAAAPGREPRRHHKRFVPRKTTLSCAPHAGLLRKIGIKTNTGVRVVDLSLGGAQVVCDRKLARGLKVDLEIEFEDGRVFAAEARVGWCRRDTFTLKPRWNVGVRFERLGEEARKVLLEAQQFHSGWAEPSRR